MDERVKLRLSTRLPNAWCLTIVPVSFRVRLRFPLKPDPLHPLVRVWLPKPHSVFAARAGFFIVLIANRDFGQRTNVTC